MVRNHKQQLKTHKNFVIGIEYTFYSDSEKPILTAIYKGKEHGTLLFDVICAAFPIAKNGNGLTPFLSPVFDRETKIFYKLELN